MKPLVEANMPIPRNYLTIFIVIPTEVLDTNWVTQVVVTGLSIEEEDFFNLQVNQIISNSIHFIKKTIPQLRILSQTQMKFLQILS